jgi:hypothetical protein
MAGPSAAFTSYQYESVMSSSFQWERAPRLVIRRLWSVPLRTRQSRVGQSRGELTGTARLASTLKPSLRPGAHETRPGLQSRAHWLSPWSAAVLIQIGGWPLLGLLAAARLSTLRRPWLLELADVCLL